MNGITLSLSKMEIGMLTLKTAHILFVALTSIIWGLLFVLPSELMA